MVYRFGRFSDAEIIEGANRRAAPIIAGQQSGWDEASNELFILKHFAEEMNERNWSDKRLYILRHLDRLSAALGLAA
jgi:hypothetical protein